MASRWRKHGVRLIWWTGALALGVAISLLADATPASVMIVAPLPVLLAFWLARNRRWVLAEGIVACAIGVYMGARAMQPRALAPAIAAVVDSDRRVVAEGWVLSAPEIADDGSRLRFSLERLDGVAARATVALSVASGLPDLLPGDALRVTARLRSVRGLANPGVADSATRARAAGIDLFAGVGASDAIVRLDDSDIGFRAPVFTIVFRWAARVRRDLGRAIDQVVGGGAGVFLHTAVLGERRGNDPRVEDGFRAAGATHVLSVSGLHLAAVALVFFAGLRRALAAIPRLPLWVEPRAAAALIAIPAIGFYTLVTGSAIATVRSALMMGFALMGIAIGRRGGALVAIAAAVLVLLAWSPLVISDISFQLSVISVLALAMLVPRLAPGGKAKVGSLTASTASTDGTDAVAATRFLRSRRWLGGFAAATVAVGLTTAPLVTHYFGEITPAAPLGNLLLVPLVEMIVVPCGLGGAVLGATLGRVWGWPLLTLAGWAARAALAIAEFFRCHAPVWLTRSPNAFETAALSIGFACLLASVRRSASGRGAVGAAAAMLLAVALGSMGVRDLARRWNPNLVVTFLDVGQGDAALVQMPGGATILIDGGGTYDGSFDPGAWVVEPFLRARGITRLDAVVLSHPHPDHMGGLHRILNRFPVSRLWTSGDDGHNPDYLLLLSEARARGIPTPVPVLWEAGGVVIEPLGPFVTNRAGGDFFEGIGVPEGTTVNDASLVLRAGFAGRSVLFTGDIEANGEGEIRGRMDVGQTVASDVLKVPHHGSRTSSSLEFLDAVRPGVAVMSLGWRNRFHFPRPEIVKRYRDRGVRVLRTDLNGAVTITIAPDGVLSATCVRGCR